MFFLHFVGQTPGALVQLDVLDFVSEDDCQFLFVRHESQNSASHHDLTVSGGTAEAGIGIEVKLVRQLALS